jgi:hypothetical protein
MPNKQAWHRDSPAHNPMLNCKTRPQFHSGLVSNEGSLSASRTTVNHYVIVTYWRSFDAHERSHADDVFNKKFAKLATMCSETKKLGYDMLWQGAAENQ